MVTVGGHGFGNVGLGVADTPGAHELLPLSERYAWCADNAHPGHTFNPWMGQTWCLCGERRYLGDCVVWPKSTDCGGPLVRCRHAS